MWARGAARFPDFSLAIRTLMTALLPPPRISPAEASVPQAAPRPNPLSREGRCPLGFETALVGDAQHLPGECFWTYRLTVADLSKPGLELFL